MADIKLKKALEKMMVSLKIPALLIRSVNMKQISALNDLGLKLAGDDEIHLMMAYLSSDFLHVNIFEVKRSDTYPWETKSRPPNGGSIYAIRAFATPWGGKCTDGISYTTLQTGRQ